MTTAEYTCSCDHTPDQVAGLEDCARCDAGECLVPVVAEIDPTTIKKVYSGKPGCGCGCKGNYFEDERNIRRIVKAINKGRHSAQFQSHEGFAGGTIYALESETRYYWAYTSAD